ncbi:MAG: hypothetical protein AAGG68_22870 [Bacteroidota bacterium]
MKRKLGYILLAIGAIIIILASLGIRKFNKALFKERANSLIYTAELKPIHFDWTNDSIGTYFEAQTALIIPLKFECLPHHFYVQFDTGSPDSYIYEKSLNSLQQIGLKAKILEKEDAKYVENLHFTLGGNSIKASMIKILPNYGNTFDENDTLKNIKIGTIGSDFIDNRITAIDFENQRIQVYDERPEWMKTLKGFTPFDFTGRRIMLPVILNNENYEFLYDSGCSAFGLITTKNRFNKYTDENTETIAYGANSWGNSIPITSKLSNQAFTMGNATLSLKRVSYVDLYTAMQPLMTPFTRIGGWLGNQPLNEHTMVLDAKTEEFIIIKQ